MFVEERHQEILRLLNENEKVKVKELSKRFEVTEDCIRKDLASMEAKNLLKRTYGGAVLPDTLHPGHTNIVSIRKDKNIKEAVDFITGKELLSIGIKENLERLKNELLNKDWFMTFPDFKDYVETKERAFKDYSNRIEWAKKMLVNISNAGYFSSDRTISEYNNDIWKLNK